MHPSEQQNRDLTLAPDTYLYLQNVGKGGIITVYRGPCVVSQTGQDSPVLYDQGSHKFETVARLEQAVRIAPRANEGDYVVLDCPAEDNGFPTEVSQPSRKLRKGCKIVIPGPWSEALWPGQSANVIEGHRLRSNQYLIAIIYNAEEAERNWSKTVVKPAEEKLEESEAEDTATAKGLPRPDSFAVGTRIVVKGTDVSFYIPCTGVEVVSDPKTKAYVREAVTLEQSEYCCLIGEDGKKKYPRGPKVVFPAPDQVFDEDNQGHRKFRPIELNTINGIHMKVTTDFTDEDLEKPVGADGKRPERKYQEGEELFITGKTLAIYYPREELAIIEYDGHQKHYATAIPKGEGRYLIDRESGEIKLIRGPKMLLVDPRHSILVRRVLSQHECSLWYPGNKEALDYNQNLSEVMATSPSGRSGVVSEGDYRHAMRSLASSVSYTMDEAFMAEYQPEEAGGQGGSTSTIGRSTRYTQPRILQLNTKYDGAPRIEVWPGYAVLVVGAEGSRRVIKGPQVILPEYDEKLGFMELSTGKPKNTDDLLPTAYLCIHNNQVGDIVAFESSNHVKGKVKISLRVNFDGETDEEMLRWFSVSNYVKYLCDHVRSLIAGMGKRNTIADIKANYVDLVRDAILGKKEVAEDGTASGRPGLFFEDNGMRVVEVEVLDLKLDDPNIAQMLDQAQIESVQQLIEIGRAKADLDTVKEKERIAQDKMVAVQTTRQKKLELDKKFYQDELAFELAKIEAQLAKITSQGENVKAQEVLTDISSQAELRREKALADQNHEFAVAKQALGLELLTAETEAAVKRFEAAKAGLQECLVALHRDDLAAKLAESCTIDKWLSGDSMASSIGNLLSMFPSMQRFVERGAAYFENGDGKLESSRSRS